MKEDDKMLSFITQYWIEFAFGIATSILTIGYKKLYKMIKDEKEKNEAIADGKMVCRPCYVIEFYKPIITIWKRDFIQSMQERM